MAIRAVNNLICQSNATTLVQSLGAEHIQALLDQFPPYLLPHVTISVQNDFDLFSLICRSRKILTDLTTIGACNIRCIAELIQSLK